MAFCVQAMAMQGLLAVWRAVHNGPVALMQCPLEAILDYDLDALKVLRHLLEKEMSLLVRSLLTSQACVH